VLSKLKKVHTHHSRFIPEVEQRHLRYSTETCTSYQNDLAMRNTDLKGGKFVAIRSQSISVVSAVNPLVFFNSIHGSKGEVLFFVLSHLILITTFTYLVKMSMQNATKVKT
jgi:hypothetical protein